MGVCTAGHPRPLTLGRKVARNGKAAFLRAETGKTVQLSITDGTLMQVPPKTGGNRAVRNTVADGRAIGVVLRDGRTLPADNLVSHMDPVHGRPAGSRSGLASAAGITALSLAGAGLAALLLRAGLRADVDAAVLQVVFLGLAALTVPQMLLADRLGRAGPIATSTRR